MAAPITLQLPKSQPAETLAEIMGEFRPKPEAFPKKERLYGILAISFPVFLLATLEAFTGEAIYDPTLRTILYFLILFILVTMAYATYKYEKIEKFTSIAYVFLFYIIFAMLSIVAGRIGYGLAITCAFFVFFLVCWMFHLTKEPLLIFSILITLAWAFMITAIYLGYFDWNQFVNSF